MPLFKMPLTNAPQTFQITISGKEYVCTCKYNYTAEGGWILGFSDAETDESIVENIPLVVGVNLLDGLGYLGFGGELFVYTSGNQLLPPTYENLGIESNVYFETEE